MPSPGQLTSLQTYLPRMCHRLCARRHPASSTMLPSKVLSDSQPISLFRHMPRTLRALFKVALLPPLVVLDAEVTLCMRMSSGSCPAAPPPPPLSAEPLAAAAAGGTRNPSRARGGNGALAPARDDDAPDCKRVRSAAASALSASGEL